LNSLNPGNKCCAVIPFYNEKKYLKSVVNKTLKYVDKVFAVDDGSNDNSSADLSGFESVEIISLRKNYGKGIALQTGFDEAIKQNYSFIVTLDGDNQHDPDFIPLLIEGLEKYQIVIGNRLKDVKQMPFLRILSNKITSYLLSLRTGYRILDSQCGFRAYRNEVIKNIRTTFSGYEAESEIILLAAEESFNIGFVEISTLYADEKSKMNPLGAIKGFLKVYFKYLKN